MIIPFWLCFLSFLILSLSDGFSFKRLFGHTFSLKEPTISAAVQNLECSDQRTIRNYFVGDFNNHEQATIDEKNGKPTASLGGHEFVTCFIRHAPNQSGSLIASYYLDDKDSRQLFRYRLYKFKDDPSNQYSCLMELHKPKSHIMSMINSKNYKMDDFLPNEEDFEKLEDCDIGWLKCTENDVIYYKGVLLKGECIKPSERDPTQMIRVVDELFIWPNELWVNDRVYLEDGTLIIGNRDGIPYKMIKCTSS